MIQSMTGFGKAICELPEKTVVIEVKSLNSKQLDVNLRLPQVYRDKEHIIRTILSEKLVRGKVDISIYIENSSNTQRKVINTDIVKFYYNQIKSIEAELSISNDNILNSILRLPDVMTGESETLDDSEWCTIESCIHNALNELNIYRSTEGAALANDLQMRIGLILENLEQIKKREHLRLDKIRDRIRQMLEENVGSENVDRNRFEQELIFYIEKLDITEEKVRLTQHCDFFMENIKEGAYNGKKLNFIAQEIGREINTIGSKANDADIQRFVVMMKDELEKIKEQSLNVL